MRNRITICVIMVLSVLLFLVPGVYAEMMDLSALLNLAAKSNPAIIAAERMFDASKAGKISGVWLDQPVIGVEYFLANGGVMGSVQQSIPMPWTWIAKARYTSSEKEQRDVMRTMTRNEIASKVKAAYAAYWRDWNKERDLRNSIEVMKQYSGVARSEYETGKGSGPGLLEARTAISRMENERDMTEAEMKSSLDQLSALIGTSVTIQGSQPVYAEEIPAVSIASQGSVKGFPLIRAEDFERGKSKASFSLAKAEWFPDVMLGAKFGMSGTSLMASASVPIYFWKQAAEVRKMRNEYEAAGRQYQNALNSTWAEMRALIYRYEAARKSALRYRDVIIPLSEQTVKLQLSSYSTGKIGFSDVSMAFISMVNDKAQYYSVVAESRMLLAEMERISGRNFN